MKQKPTQLRPHHWNVGSSRRRGFTLIELLVSVALLLTMMVMFSIVFRLASGSVSSQRGIATNDQRSRTLVTVLKNDLKYRSFRSIIPFAPNETDPGSGNRSFDLRRGYFTVSENDTDNDTDDVLSFTIELPPDQPSFYGKATPLSTPESAATWQSRTTYVVGDWVEPITPNGFVYRCTRGGKSFTTEPTWPTTPGAPVNEMFIPPGPGVKWITYAKKKSRNQPEWDDGEGGNDSGASRIAEVSYWLRNGTLYRRVMLVRQPLESSWNVQPTDSPRNREYFAPSYNPPYTGIFWEEFDYSAYYLQTGPDGRAMFLGEDSLNNGSGVSGILGKPRYRFGYNSQPIAPNYGQPREYFTDSSSQQHFIGRFTLGETSSSNFRYPHYVDGTVGNPLGNPMSSDKQLNMNNVDDIVEYSIQSRRGEDALMFDVHRFDVEIWDDAIEQFVDVGHNIASGDLNQNQNQHVSANLVYGPRTNPVQNRLYDTWHPSYDLGGSDSSNQDDPPFRPLHNDAMGSPDPSNPKRLKAIRITIQFYDRKSDQIRQVTVVQSLLDDKADE